jgi:two-component system NtrC family sensor kinase
MIFAPLLSFLLVLYLRNSLKKSQSLPPWYPYLNYALIAIVILFVSEEVVFHGVLKLVWPVILFLIISFILKQPEFSSSRNLIIAVLPLAVISSFENLLDIWNNKFTRDLSSHLGFIYPFAFVWLITFFIVFKRQQKVLAKERKKREEEHQLNKMIEARKGELEVIVAERTSEITKQKDELQLALNKLTATQSQLIQSEKMASLGELTAGIAHEIQNPLNFVNNFSEVNAELVDELKIELTAGNMQHAMDIANNIKENEQKIIFHGKRADAIVKGMLQHSRSSSGVKEPTNINALADEYLRLAYHGLRAKDKTFNATMKTDYDETVGNINIVPQDIGRVILNLITNAFYAVTEKQKENIPGYEPIVRVSTKRSLSSGEGGGEVEIKIADNGNGIPQKMLDKIFQPFFTTKPTGQGTGLGLSLSYDIIKAHSGEIKVDTKEKEYTEFTILLPL